MKLEFDFSELVAFGNKLVTTYDNVAEEITQKLARTLYSRLKQNTPAKTGELRSGWDKGDNLAFRVQKTSEGFVVELCNQTKYAEWVNYGHHSYNQLGGPYVVKNRTVKYYQGNNAATFVYGVFFVEKSILELEESKAVKKLAERCLAKWYEGCTR